jgi:hypothetical protein
MASEQDGRVVLAAKLLLLLATSSRKKSVKEAMRDAGFIEDEIKCKTRAKEAAVRRAYYDMKKKTTTVETSIQEININSDSIISPLSETSYHSRETTSTASKSILKTKPKITIPGMKVVRQTSYQVNAMAQNSLMKKQLRDAAIKEATIAWKEASESKMKGEEHRRQKDIIEMINNKPINKENDICVYARSLRRYVSEGIVGLTPPRKGCPGKIPPVAYRALKDAMVTFIKIHQASGKYEYTRSDLSKIVNDVVNSHPNENRRSDKLMARLQKDFGPELTLERGQKVEERRVKWTTYSNLNSWGESAKEILIELGFGRESTPEDNIHGEIYFFAGQLQRILNFDETRIGLDQTDTIKGGRPSFVFYDSKMPRPGSSANKSSLSLTLIVGATAAGELIPPHFQLTTDSQNEEVQVWNTSISKYMHDVYGKFGCEDEKYHPCTFGMNERGGMNKEEFEEYVKNSLVTLYPDAADVPGKRVLLKADSGPGRKNIDLMAYLRVRGFYFLPGLPNSTHVTQEMELLIGQLKSYFYENLEKLTRGCLMRHNIIPSGAEIIGLLLFGGLFFHNENDDGEQFINSFQAAGQKEKIFGYFERIGFAPFTRNYLKNKHVRHDMATDPIAGEYDALEHQNTMACAFLNFYGYNSDSLVAQIDRKKNASAQQTLTRPATLERAKALACSVTHGQQFRVTGGHHLTSSDFFIADAIGNLEREQKAMAAERKARLKQQQQYEAALPLLSKPEHTLLSKDLDILLRYKLGELPGNLRTKNEILQRWQMEKEKPGSPLKPWTDEDEEKYLSLAAKEITLQDTALGRQNEALRQHAISSIASMSEKERRAIRKVLDDLDTQL